MSRRMRYVATLLLSVSLALLARSAPTAGDAPRLPATPSPDIDPDRLARIDTAVQQALDRGAMPGAVVLVVHRGEVVFRRAYGLRSKQPAPVPMTADTLFDLASLTKPIATATSLMLLVEQGKLRPTDRVVQHLPAFGQNGKDKITVEQLLL